MQSYIELLRAVNVWGTGKLPMAELKAMCEAAGFASSGAYTGDETVHLHTELAGLLRQL